MSTVREKILKARFNELETRWERLTEKLNRVAGQRDMETRAEEKARMDAVISETQAERAQIAVDMEKLSTPSSYPSPQGAREINAVGIFYSYAHEDELLRDKLNTHLKFLERQGFISSWHDRQIGAGREWEHEISKYLESARIILLLVSADFLASDYIHDVELKRAMERHESGEARVIPIILRDCDWATAPFGKLQALPKDAKPLTSWPDQDEAFADIARGIRRVAGELAGSGSPLGR